MAGWDGMRAHACLHRGQFSDPLAAGPFKVQYCRTVSKGKSNFSSHPLLSRVRGLYLCLHYRLCHTQVGKLATGNRGNTTRRETVFFWLLRFRVVSHRTDSSPALRCCSLSNAMRLRCADRTEGKKNNESCSD